MARDVRSAIARRLPWRIVFALGVTCLVLGAFLIADPFRSLTVLALLVAGALVATGIGEMASAGTSPRPWVSGAAGLVWVVSGVLAASWRGITIHALAVTVGVALVAGGVGKLASARSGRADERFVLGLSGLTNVVVGALALGWPAVTVLVLAVLFGVRTVVLGFGLTATALRLRRAAGPGARESGTRESESPGRWRRSVRVVGSVTALALALGGMGVSVAIHRAQPPFPGPFYSAPDPLPAGPPGTIIRTEVIDGFTSGATTYRVLYISTGYDAAPTAVSGLIVVPDGPIPSGGRKIIDYVHGTIGVATNCAPSLQGAVWEHVMAMEGLAAFVRAGYVVAATDYQGLGTPGPHPYLVGASEAENGLDIVRAAHRFPPAHAGTDFAVWGHSQGGHASLFTGQITSTYAPELHLAGVAAGAPVPDLEDLLAVNIRTTVGKVLISMALQSWEQVYHDARLDQIVTPAARPAVAKIADHCLYNQKQILASVPSSLLLSLTFLSNPPWETEPWKTIVAQNTPGGSATEAPILISQGTADPIVEPAVTARFVQKLCGLGDTVDYVTYPGVGHLDGSQAAVPDVTAWIADRFAGAPAPSTCP
jgi:uncharacterized membrane protein HdeD (DUF308 family)/alpha-beta hydrolase superfamily lysophospholipase